MFGSFGVPELVILVVTLILLIPAWRIVARMGFPGWMSVGIIIPLVNIVLWFVLAFVEWPLERELRQLKESRSAGTR